VGDFWARRLIFFRPKVVWYDEGSAPVTALAFSRDGGRFAVGYLDGVSQLYDTDEFQSLGSPAIQRSSVKRIVVSDDGSSWTTVINDGSVRTWPATRPMPGTPDKIALQLEIETGMTFQRQSCVRLTDGQWRMRKQSEKRIPVEPMDENDWHRARVLDAEEDGDARAATWHLDRLIRSEPDDWVLYARRARMRRQLRMIPEANDDNAKASQLTASSGETNQLAWWPGQSVAATRASK